MNETQLIAIISTLVSCMTVAFTKLIDFVISYFKQNHTEEQATLERRAITELVQKNVYVIDTVADRLENLDDDHSELRSLILEVQRDNLEVIKLLNKSEVNIDYMKERIDKVMYNEED